MIRLRNWTSFAISMLSMTAFSVAITCGVNAQTEKVIVTKSASRKIATLPGPQSGIKLIEFISARIHSLKGPVIAMTNAKQMYQAPPPEQNSGPTDKLLALKPPSKSYVPKEEWNEEAKPRKLAMLDERKADKEKASADSESEPRRSGARWDFAPNVWKKESVPNPVGNNNNKASDLLEVASKPQPSPQTTATTIANAYARQLPDRLRDGPLAKSLANLHGSLAQADGYMKSADSGRNQVTRMKTRSSPRAEASYTVASNNQPTGIWEPTRQQSVGLLAQQKAKGPAAGAAGNVGDETVETPAQAPLLPAGYYKNTRLGSVAGKQIGIPGDNQYSSDGIASGGGGAQIRDYKRGALLSSNSSNSAPPAAAPSLQAAAIPPPPPLVASFGSQLANARGNLLKRTEVAMLPPNVITGIPLVRLGSSALDATKALTSVKGNKLKQQSINGWTVYVLHKANSTDPAMQVYMRHGLVEAMRVFDSALIAPDFGVQLNDDISVVKAKFGEPAFMVPEPECPSARNYIYPISQVSFELALPPHSTSPKVVSVLIFTVK